jgi:lipopolysaccharide export system protein LptA
MIKTFFIIFNIFFCSLTYAENIVKAKESLIWDSGNKSYTALGSVEFRNDIFAAFSEKMVAEYIESNNKEIFTKVEMFEEVRIELNDEIFKGNYAVYTRNNNIIKLIGDVSIQSPTRLLKGYELIADISNNKRILNSDNNESLVEILLENNAGN